MVNIKQLIALQKNLSNAFNNVNNIECTCIEKGDMCDRCNWGIDIGMILETVEEEIDRLKTK